MEYNMSFYTPKLNEDWTLPNSLWLQGLDEIPDSEREAFKKAFGVTGSGKATKKRTSGRLAQEEAPPKAKKAKSGGGKAAAKQESEEEGSDGEEVDVDKSDGEQREEEEEIKQVQMTLENGKG
jgi:hypothetical protein